MTSACVGGVQSEIYDNGSCVDEPVCRHSEYFIAFQQRYCATKELAREEQAEFESVCSCGANGAAFKSVSQDCSRRVEDVCH